MGKVEFHHGTGDKLAYACRLLRKAYKAGAQVVVTGDEASLRTLDKYNGPIDGDHATILGKVTAVLRRI